MKLENNMVFIIGLPRTGSTLLRTLINKSEHASITMETHFLHQVSSIGKKKKILKFGDLSIDENANRLVDYLHNDNNIGRSDFWGWLAKNSKREDFRELMLASDRSDRAIFDIFMYLYTLWKQGQYSPNYLLGEKTSANMYYVPKLLDWYPNAKLIHTFRDPRGIFSSAAKLARAGKWGIRKRLSPVPQMLVDPLINFGMAAYVSKKWKDAAGLHRDYQERYPDRYRLVRFEDLVQDPHTIVPDLFSFLNLPFESSMLDEVRVVGSSFKEQRYTPGGFDAQAVTRWQEAISPLYSSWFSLVGGKRLETFGYSR